jgi:hypothetical protein
VQLAVSRLGGLPGAAAYHSSVLVGGQEYSFGAQYGIAGPFSGCSSHDCLNGDPTLYDLGFTSCTGHELQKMLSPYFERGTYDMLAKNCNTFSDCALFVLMRQRLDSQYSAVERLCNNYPTMVNYITGGKYKPNPRATNFDLDIFIRTTLYDCSDHIQRVRSSVTTEPLPLLNWPISFLDPCRSMSVKKEVENLQEVVPSGRQASDFLDEEEELKLRDCARRHSRQTAEIGEVADGEEKEDPENWQLDTRKASADVALAKSTPRCRKARPGSPALRNLVDHGL